MSQNINTDAAAFTGAVDLVSQRLGGKTLLCSDDFFAEADNMLKPGKAIFIVDKYTDRGKWMDGWESRRKRVPGHDWCIVRLGVPGIVNGIDIDTAFFLGNNPAYASIEGLYIEPGDERKSNDGAALAERTDWTMVLPRSGLKPGSQNIFGAAQPMLCTHIRLNIYPDGGVARLRVYGQVTPVLETVKPDQVIDLAGIVNGGAVVGCSDMFFGNKDNMIMPDKAANMGDGWETKRRRGPGYDWAIIKLACAGMLKKIELDTAYFKGNYPDHFWLEGCHAPGADIDNLTWPEHEWVEIIGKTKLKADSVHAFEKEIAKTGPWTHLRLNIAPDGGVSRFRVWGTVAAGAVAAKSKAGAAGARSK